MTWLPQGVAMTLKSCEDTWTRHVPLVDATWSFLRDLLPAGAIFLSRTSAKATHARIFSLSLVGTKSPAGVATQIHKTFSHAQALELGSVLSFTPRQPISISTSMELWA